MKWKTSMQRISHPTSSIDFVILTTPSICFHLTRLPRFFTPPCLNQLGSTHCMSPKWSGHNRNHREPRLVYLTACTHRSHCLDSSPNRKSSGSTKALQSPEERRFWIVSSHRLLQLQSGGNYETWKLLQLRQLNTKQSIWHHTEGLLHTVKEWSIIAMFIWRQFGLHCMEEYNSLNLTIIQPDTVSPINYKWDEAISNAPWWLAADETWGQLKPQRTHQIKVRVFFNVWDFFGFI